MKSALLGATLALAALPAMATTITTSRSAWQAGVGAATVVSTPNPGSYDLTGLFLPTTSSIALANNVTLNLSSAAQVTQPQNGFPYNLSSGFTGELFVPGATTETITFGSNVSALGFELASYGAAVGQPNFGIPGGPYTVTVTYGGGQSSTVQLAGGNFNTGVTPSAFFGFFGGGITALTITTTDPDGFGFGNFVDVATAVPEPASAALLLAGVTAMVARGRKRSQLA